MVKRRVDIRLLGILICIFTLSMSVYAQDLQGVANKSELMVFSAKSEKQIIGRFPDLDISFSSTLEKEDYVVVDVRLKNKKQLIAQINYKDETFRIKFISLESGELLKLTKEDLLTFHVLYANLSRHFPSIEMWRVVDALVSVLNLLEGYPPNESLDIFHESMQIRPQVWTSLCESIGSEITGTYDITEGIPITESEIVGPCASGDCFGRCGPGCGFPPDPLTQRFTQECFNHDLCARATGQWFGPCLDEWLAAVDAFLFATNCNAITGDWTIDMTGTSCFEGDCADIYSIKVYHFRYNPITYSFTGISDPSTIDGRVSVYRVTLLTGNNTSGSWRYSTYMGPECGYQPAGYAKGTFTGQNNCGKMTMNLNGVWGWYYIDTCTSAGYGSFIGNSIATRNAWDLTLEDRVEKRTNIEKSVVPSTP